MALIVPKLIIELSQFLDPESKLYVASPADAIDAANKWSSALHNYMSMVSPPAPALPATALAAKTVMLSSFVTAIQSGTLNTQFSFILTTYATSLILGFAPNYIATPPAIPLNTASAFSIAQAGGPSAAFITLIAITVDSWMRTGTASLVTPTGVLPPIPWF